MLNYTTIHATLGKGFADKTDEIVFAIGDMEFSRREFIDTIGNANFIAASRLTKVLKRLKINTITKLHKIDPYSLYRVKGIGDTAVYVAMCVLASHGADVIKWWGPETVEKHAAIRKAKKRKQEV